MSKRYPIQVSKVTHCEHCAKSLPAGVIASFEEGARGAGCTDCYPLSETHVKVAKPTPKPLSPDEYTILMGIVSCLDHFTQVDGHDLVMAARMAGVEDFNGALKELQTRHLVVEGEPGTYDLTQKGAALVGMLHAQRR